MASLHGILIAMKQVLLVALLLLPVVFRGEEPSVKTAVEKALPYLESEGTWWIEKKKCVSCHHTSFFVWAKDLALSAGYDVDPATLKEQREWMIASFLNPVEPNPEVKESVETTDEINADRNMEGVAQFLFSPSSQFATTEEKDALLKSITSNQQPNGDWKPGGQLPRQQRPKHETQWTSNQWAQLATKGTPHEPSKPATISKDGSPAKTTEWYALRLIENPTEKSTELLLTRQQEDGGWAWIDGDSSGPIATGMALLALHRSGTGKRHSEAVKKAKSFLVSTQLETGEWKTISTKDRSESTSVSDFWGTTWALIGLLETNASMEGQTQ